MALSHSVACYLMFLGSDFGVALTLYCCLEWVLNVVLYSIAGYLMYAIVDQLPWLRKRELVFLLLFACNFMVCVSKRFLFVLVLGMGCVFLMLHSLDLPLIIIQASSYHLYMYVWFLSGLVGIPEGHLLASWLLLNLTAR